MTRVLITGATGFVGGHIARALLSGGHEVTGLVRDPAKGGSLAEQGATLARGDMLDPSSYQPLVAKADAVVHTAQYAVGARLGRRGVRAIEAADALMTSTLASECQRLGRRFVYTSGCFNYGDRGEEWIGPGTPFAPSPLGRGHVRQVLALREHRDQGLDLVVISPGFVYGPGGLFVSAFCDQLQKGRLRVIGSGHNWWSCVHVEDLAAAYVAAIERAEPGTEVDAVDGSPVRLRDMVDLLTGALGRKQVGTVPPALIGLLIGAPLAASLATSFRIRGDHARDVLGWQPVHARFADGLPPTLAALGLPAGG
jgi:nucleoside-diphosphate-sugar epimerase